jgi:hypothetical protein
MVNLVVLVVVVLVSIHPKQLAALELPYKVLTEQMVQQ